MSGLVPEDGYFMFGWNAIHQTPFSGGGGNVWFITFALSFPSSHMFCFDMVASRTLLHFLDTVVSDLSGKQSRTGKKNLAVAV